MKINFKEIYKCGFWAWIGILFSAIMWHGRFSHEILRRELILYMQEGNGYFLFFAWIDLFFVILMGLCYLYFKRKETSQNRRKEKLK